MEEDDLDREWNGAAGEYAFIVASRGTGSDAAREAWKRADEALERLVEERANKDAAAPFV